MRPTIGRTPSRHCAGRVPGDDSASSDICRRLSSTRRRRKTLRRLLPPFRPVASTGNAFRRDAEKSVPLTERQLFYYSHADPPLQGKIYGEDKIF